MPSGFATSFIGDEIFLRHRLSAIHRRRNSKLSFWDALIVQAAIEGHASTLCSEDMQHGQMQDKLRVVNPFS